MVDCVYYEEQDMKDLEKENLELRKQLALAHERFRKYEESVIADFKLLRKFALKYNIKFYTLTEGLDRFEELLDSNEATKHAIQTVKEYTEKLGTITDFLDKERAMIFDDFQSLQKARSYRTEKNSTLKFWHEWKKEV